MKPTMETRVDIHQRRRAIYFDESQLAELEQQREMYGSTICFMVRRAVAEWLARGGMKSVSEQTQK